MRLTRFLTTAALFASAGVVGTTPASACTGTCTPALAVGNCVTVSSGGFYVNPWTGQVTSYHADVRVSVPDCIR